MPFTIKGKQNMLTALGATHFALHTGSTASSANEVTGGSPGYTRKVAALSAPDSSGVVSVTTDSTFDVPAGASIASVGLWDAATGGNLLGYIPLRNSEDTADAPETYTRQGLFTVRSGSTYDLNK